LVIGRKEEFPREWDSCKARRRTGLWKEDHGKASRRTFVRSSPSGPSAADLLVGALRCRSRFSPEVGAVSRPILRPLRPMVRKARKHGPRVARGLPILHLLWTDRWRAERVRDDDSGPLGHRRLCVYPLPDGRASYKNPLCRRECCECTFAPLTWNSRADMLT